MCRWKCGRTKQTEAVLLQTPKSVSRGGRGKQEKNNKHEINTRNSNGEAGKGSFGNKFKEILCALLSDTPYSLAFGLAPNAGGERTCCNWPLWGKKKAQVISPTACGGLFSARTTPQPSQNLVEPWWNPGGTLQEPWWNPGGSLVEPS